MTKMKVIRDNKGNIINIGDWDYAPYTEERKQTIVVSEMVPSTFMDSDGKPMLKKVDHDEVITTYHEIKSNPLPKGAYEDTADIVRDKNGGLIEKV